MNTLTAVKSALLLSIIAVFLSANARAEEAAECAGPEPVYVVIMNHVEGDTTCLPDETTCLKSIEYQTIPLPPRGIPLWNGYSVDIAGNDLIYSILLKYTDSFGHKPKLFIEPAGEWWQTYLHPVFGGKAFDKFNYLALGNEFGIQGHAIMYSGIDFGWFLSPHTEWGVHRKFRDMSWFADHAYYKGRPVNGGKTFTGGWKLERAGLGDEYAEVVIDHAAYAQGYRISFEDHDGHIKDEPAGIGNLHASPFVYRAMYPDGVWMTKLDMNGSVSGDCQGNTSRCETPAEAALRFDRTLQARASDHDPKKVYFFGFVTHSGGVWNDFNMTAPGQPLQGEGLGLTAIMDAIQLRVANGARIKFVTPMEVTAIFNARNPLPFPAAE